MKKLLIALLLTIVFTCDCTASNKPNIIIIYADDLGYADVGCYGAIGVQTPNIARDVVGCRCWREPKVDFLAGVA